MLKRYVFVWAILPAYLILASSGGQKVADDGSNWLMYGRTSDDHRFSPLKQIDEQTVSKLGLIWSTELGTTRGLEATPLVDDGVIYTTGSWSGSFRDQCEDREGWLDI